MPRCEGTKRCILAARHTGECAHPRVFQGTLLQAMVANLDREMEADIHRAHLQLLLSAAEADSAGTVTVTAALLAQMLTPTPEEP